MHSDATRAVEAVLHRSRATCLVRSVVRQRWLLAQGDQRAIVIGVTGPGQPFRAHAWLEGDSPDAHQGLVELVRLPAPRQGTYLR